MAERRRKTREESRAALLSAGIDVLVEKPTSGIRHARATDVVSRLGLTSGAFYNIWPSQEEFQHDLLEEVFDPKHWPTVGGARSMARDMASGGATFDELIAAGAALAWSQVQENEQMLRLQFALWAGGDPTVASLIARQYQIVSHRWIEMFELVVSLYDLRPRTPNSLDKLSMGLTALVEGLYSRFVVEQVASEDASTKVSEGVFADMVRALVYAAVAAPSGKSEDTAALRPPGTSPI